MTAQTSLSPRARLASAAIVTALHALLGLLLLRAFAPLADGRIARRLEAVLTVEIAPVDHAAAPVQPKRARAARGARTAPARPAIARAVSAPVPAAEPAIVSASADAFTSGAMAPNTGTGTGIGAGSAGLGTGGGAGVTKIAGDINSARDYPAASRALRLGDYVVIALTVGADGRAGDCRITRASRDAAADRITCDLARARFRFRPARNTAGEATPAVYGWKQRWFAPGAMASGVTDGPGAIFSEPAARNLIKGPG